VHPSTSYELEVHGMEDQQELLLPPGAGHSVALGGLGVVFKLVAEDTGGTFALVEHPLAPSQGRAGAGAVDATQPAVTQERAGTNHHGHGLGRAAVVPHEDLHA
jgi:hypothetical protein